MQKKTKTKKQNKSVQTDPYDEVKRISEVYKILTGLSVKEALVIVELIRQDLNSHCLGLYERSKECS